jgi:hypothetical protein
MPRPVFVFSAALALVVALSAAANAQNFGGFNNRSVGGVAINTDGVLRNASVDEIGLLARQWAAAAEKVPAGLQAAVPLRKVSLRRLEEAIRTHQDAGRPLPDAISCLGGLQRIEYVFVYPEDRDIVLVGPGEGWKVDRRCNVVGVQSGRPVMLLDDLLVALRSAKRAAQGGISASIDPTPEGLKRLQAHTKQLTTIGNPQDTAAGIEQVLGPQKISVTGVPDTSHFAQVLVAADFRMKRIAMAFEPAPVRGLPSFLQMTTGSRGMSTPRWWLEPKYDTLLRDPGGLAWQLRGASVKAMTEEDFLTANGTMQHSGKADPVAQKWADTMTAKYGELAVAEPIFGQLQNCMDLAVVSALIVKERLTEKSGHSLPVLLEGNAPKPAEFAAPKTCDSQASVLKKGRNWVISASGGVLINSWAIADKTQAAEAPAQARAKAAAVEPKNCWWA